jgi:chromosome segregation ATPase
VLALINQGLLHAVGGRIDRVRLAARTWFDLSIWRRVAGGAQSSTTDAVAAIERFARIVAASADQHAASFGRIDESTSAMRQAAAQFRDVVGSFHGEIKGVPQALAVLQEAMSASARALQELIPMGARAIANLDVSVAAFRSTIDQEFKDAAALHHSSSKSLGRTVSQIVESTDLLKSSADEMKRSLEAMSGTAGSLEDAGGRLQRTIEKDAAPAQSTMHDAAAAFARSASQLTEFIEQGVAPATQQLAALHTTLAAMDEAVQSIKRFSQSRADIDRLTASLARSAEIAEAIAALPEQIRGLLEESAAQQAETLQARNRKTWLGGRPR